MASKLQTVLTARDLSILNALVKTPLDTKQLLAMSKTFPQPFTHERLVRRRLQRLSEAGLVSRFQYATFGTGALNYYKLTPLGFQMIHGTRSPLPTRSYFRPVSLALQEHTRSLADFIVATHVAAHRDSGQITGFWRENELQLRRGDQTLKPDCAFQLIGDDGRTYNYLVEIDCGTEPIRSTKQRESLLQKIRFYDRYQDVTDKRFRLLVLFTKPSARLAHFLQTVYDTTANRQRHLFYGAFLSHYILAERPLHASVFFDHSKHEQTLLPLARKPAEPSAAKTFPLFMAEAASVW